MVASDNDDIMGEGSGRKGGERGEMEKGKFPQPEGEGAKGLERREEL